jgi:plasmid replication initiation protein
MTKGQENVFALSLKALNEKMMAQPLDMDGKLTPLSVDDFYVDLDFYAVRDVMMANYAQGRNEEFKKAIKIMVKEAQIDREFENKKGKLEYEVYQIFTSIRVSEVKNRVRFRFNWELTEQYQDRDFFLYHLDDYLALDSSHARRLYELFQKVYYRSDKNNALGYVFKPSVDELREYLGIESESSYDEFKHFNAKIIKKAVAEINKNTELTVFQKNIKRGRYVRWIEFDLRRNPDFRTDRHEMQQSLFGGETAVKDLPVPQGEYYNWLEEGEIR